jgi:uncharacterized LabA/DUF88 family protein
MNSHRFNRMVTDLNERVKDLEWRERIAVFIDNSNLFRAIHHLNGELEGRRIDYVKLKEFLTDGRILHALRFYYSEPPFPRKSHLSPDEYEAAKEAASKRQSFHYVLERNGYETIAIPQRQIRISRDFDEPIVIDKGLEPEIIYDMCALSRDGKYDTFILVAGDEEYARAIQKIQQEKAINVEVAFPSTDCSPRLQDIATDFIDLLQYEDVFRNVKGDNDVSFVKEEEREYCNK